MLSSGFWGLEVEGWAGSALGALSGGFRSLGAEKSGGSEAPWLLLAVEAGHLQMHQITVHVDRSTEAGHPQGGAQFVDVHGARLEDAVHVLRWRVRSMAA